MADGTSFSSAYELKLYWQTEGLQKSVSIYPASCSFQIPPQYIKVIGRRVTQHVDVVWLATWLRSCGLVASTKHPATARSTSMTSTLFKIRLIDVQRGCLVEGNLDWAYVCLSYVWGGTAIPKLTKERHARYRTKNGIYENGMKAVQTITDAINLVSCLGFRYLWVDALCIMQDDSVDISTYIPHMGHIYRGAVVTIVSDSRSASTGIPGISKPRPKSSATLNAHGYNLVASKMTLSESLETSTWFRRGWTLQEMCFSQCILLFTESQVFFQGGDSIYMEDGRIDTSGATYAGDSQNILARLEPDAVALPIMSRSRPPSTNPILRPSTSNLVDLRTTQPGRRHDKEEYFLEGESSTAKYNREMQEREYMERAQKRRLRLEAFSKYKQLVQAYAGRALTYERDILRAFEGVLEYFQGILGPHIWGLPEDGFGEALLWQIEKPNTRRKGYPSWSWCGWHLGFSSRLTYLDSSSRSAEYFQGIGRGTRSNSVIELPQVLGSGATVARTTMDSTRNMDLCTITVRATYSTLGIRRGISRPGETHRFKVVETAGGRWLADITLGPEWADWAQRNTQEVMFWELSRRDGRSMNQGHGGFQNGRPRTSGYKYYFPDIVIVMAVMRDEDDLWERVQVCEINKEEWEPLSSKDKGVFRLK
ncbi:hypothetical protein NM208_g3162 [Fusarium decemcellulare]|uniref:Uncharacterized protein n=1 Tax=Fusarium decemcellulare TaxID=57161 RepID=A0ACC1SQ86_9HYPO|nr:hypothetical protein NM208_g3162 [Fusarium decemcellulare]